MIKPEGKLCSENIDSNNIFRILHFSTAYAIMPVGKKDKIYIAGNCVFMYNHGLDTFIEPGVKIKRPFYTAAYEGDYGTVVVNEFDSNKYKSICQSIEEMSDDEFNGVLKRLYEDSSQVQEQYPKLLIREKK